MTFVITVPALVRNKAAAAGATQWLADLPSLVSGLERDWSIEVAEDDPHARARFLAARSGLYPTAIWEWGVVERVSTGLLCTKIDLQPGGREMLTVADQVAGER
jgi:hypothetical protein